MAGQLTKDTQTTFLPGSPAVAGSPGTPGTPAYCEMVQPAPYPRYIPVDVFVPYQPARTVGGIVFPAIPAHVVYTYRTETVTPPAVEVCYPGTPGSPPTPGTPSSPSQTLADYRLGWNAGAISDAAFPSDCALTLSVTASSVGIVVGLNGSNAGAGYAEIDHALYFSHGRALVYEAGVQKGFVHAFASADSFEIRRVGTLVTYYQNAALIYTSDVASTGNVFADSSFYAGGDRITSIEFAALGSASGTGADSAGTSYASFEPLAGHAANKSYAASAGAFPPLAGTLGVGELIPTYAVSAGALAYLLGAGRMLTGEQASSAASLPALQGFAADRAYAGSAASLQPLQGLAGQAAVLDGVASMVLAGSVFTLLASGMQRERNRLAAVLPRAAFGLTAFAGASAQTVCPPAHLSASGDIANVGRAVMLAPAMTLDARGTMGLQGEVNAVLAGQCRLTAFGGASLQARAPGMTLTASATTEAVGSLRAVLKNRFSASGFAGAVLTQRLSGVFSLDASGANVPTGSLQATMPACALRASGSEPVYGQARMIMPRAMLKGAPNALRAWMPACRLHAMGRPNAVAAALREAWAMNLRGGNEDAAVALAHEVTHYTHYPFNQIVSFDGVTYGASDAGLFRLDGDTDAGAPIAWSFQTCATDFKSPQLKSLPEVFMSGKLGSGATVDVLVGEMADNAYQYTNVRGTPSQNHRFKFGRGMRSRLYALGVVDPDGGELSLDGIEFAVIPLSRKI